MTRVSIQTQMQVFGAATVRFQNATFAADPGPDQHAWAALRIDGEQPDRSYTGIQIVVLTDNPDNLDAIAESARDLAAQLRAVQTGNARPSAAEDEPKLDPIAVRPDLAACERMAAAMGTTVEECEKAADRDAAEHPDPDDVRNMPAVNVG